MLPPHNYGWRWRDVVSGEGGWGDYWELPSPEVLSFAARLDRLRRGRVLDIGAGIGRHLMALAQSGLEAHGLDVSIDGLEIAAKRLNQAGLTAHFTRADMAYLPYRENSFDGALAVSTINHGTYEVVAGAITEVRRILKPNGKFLLTITSKRSPEYGLGEKAGTNAYLHETSGRVHYYADRSDLERLLAGFRLLEVAHKEEELLTLPQPRYRAYWVVLASKRTDATARPS